MEITGRNGHPITSVDEWHLHGGPASATHWKPGRSAYELAADFTERDAERRLQELISLIEEVDDLELLTGIAEKKTSFDARTGPRNHDLLVQASSGSGPVTVGVEAKADEPFDDPLWLYRERR